MNCHVRSHNYAWFTPTSYVNLWCVYMITNECYLMGKHRCQELGLCTADVRYGINVNTSTNPYLQVDTFPKAYQASSITPVCQSTGSEPDQIHAMQRCWVGRYESRESTCLLPQTKTYNASSLPAFGFIWPKFGPMPVVAIAVIK